MAVNFFPFSQGSTSGKQLFHSMARGLVPYPGKGMARALFQSMARGLVPYLRKMKGMEQILGCPDLLPGLSSPAPGLTVSPAVCCFERFVVASGDGHSKRQRLQGPIH